MCFCWVQITPSPRVHISHSHFPTSLASVCITPKALTKLPRTLFSLSVYTIPVATFYNFVEILLLLVLCCTVSFLSLFILFCLPHSSFTLFLFPSISPSPHPSPISFIPPFQLHFFLSPSFQFLIQLFPFHYHSFPPPFSSLSS